MTALRWAVFSCVLAATSVAGAQPQDTRPLFFATGTVGLGDCGGGYCRHHIDGDGGDNQADTGPFLGFGAGFFIRPIPYFAGGVFLHYQLMGAEDENPDRFGEVARYFLANLALRGILPIDAIDLFAELSFGYAWWGYAHDRDGGRTDDVTFDGIDVMLGLGLDYALSEQWAIGGIFRFGWPSFSDRCVERIEPGEQRLDCDSWEVLEPDERDDAPAQLWYLGFTGSFRFGG